MQDLAVIVHSQDGLIDNIESAVEVTEQKTREAGSELSKVSACPCGGIFCACAAPLGLTACFSLPQAAEYQRKTRKLTVCLFAIMIILVGIIIVYLMRNQIFGNR